jgi:hypothetical protein
MNPVIGAAIWMSMLGVCVAIDILVINVAGVLAGMVAAFLVVALVVCLAVITERRGSGPYDSCGG